AGGTTTTRRDVRPRRRWLGATALGTGVAAMVSLALGLANRHAPLRPGSFAPPELEAAEVIPSEDLPQATIELPADEPFVAGGAHGSSVRTAAGEAGASTPLFGRMHRAPRAAGSVHPANGSCTLPYTRDAEGNKIYKRECL